MVEKLSSVSPTAAEEKSNRNNPLPLRQVHLEGLAPAASRPARFTLAQNCPLSQ